MYTFLFLFLFFFFFAVFSFFSFSPDFLFLTLVDTKKEQKFFTSPKNKNSSQVPEKKFALFNSQYSILLQKQVKPTKGGQNSLVYWFTLALILSYEEDFVNKSHTNLISDTITLPDKVQVSQGQLNKHVLYLILYHSSLHYLHQKV